MGLVSIVERNTDRNGSLVGSPAELDGARSWIITVDDPNYDMFDVFGLSGVQAVLPARFSSHPGNLFWTCRRVAIEPTNSRLHWIAKASYSAAPVSKEEKEQSNHPNPVNRPVRVEVDSMEFQRYSLKDIEGNPLLNSADDPYSAQPTEDSRTVVHVEKDVATWTTAWLYLNNTLNSANVTLTDGVKSLTIAEGCGYLKGLKISPVKEENAYVFYTISGQIHVKDDPEEWELQLLDEGYQEVQLYGPVALKQRIKVKDPDSDEKVYPADPQLLDGDGKTLGLGGDPVFRNFKMIREAAWSDLPFFS